MVLDELNNGKFFIQDGIIYTLTPLTKIEKIEEEFKKEVESKVMKSTTKEAVLKTLGSAVEYFTENGWKISFIKDEPALFKFVIAAPFKGGEMVGLGEEYGDGNRHKKCKIYIPSGYLGMEIEIRNFPHMTRRVLLFPNIKNKSLRELRDDKYEDIYEGIHPHIVEVNNTLCNGLPDINKFNLDMIVSQIESCINGSKSHKGTSIWDYNRDSPASDINDCENGKLALELHEKGKTDDEIWKEVIKNG